MSLEKLTLKHISVNEMDITNKAVEEGCLRDDPCSRASCNKTHSMDPTQTWLYISQKEIGHSMTFKLTRSGEHQYPHLPTVKSNLHSYRIQRFEQFSTCFCCWSGFLS